MTLLLDLPPDWRYQAACGNRLDDLFFPVGISGPAEQQIKTAKAICKLCPVRSECLAWALDTCQDAGIWGGMTEEERRAIRRAGRRPLARDRCGTSSRYDLGCRCDRCTKAKSDANRKKRRRAS